MGSGSSTPVAPQPNTSDLVYPTSLGGMKVYISADISSHLLNNNILNRITNTYSLIPSTNSAITGNTGNIVRQVNTYGMPYYIMNNSAVFNNERYIDSNIGKSMTFFAVFSFNSIPPTDALSRSTIFRSSTTGAKNEIPFRTLWFGFDACGNYSPSVGVYIYNNSGQYNMYARYNFNTNNNKTLFGAHNDIIIMTVRISNGSTSVRNIYTYFYDNSGTQYASSTNSLTISGPTTSYTSDGNFNGNHQYIHVGENQVLNIYEFGLYQSDIGDNDAKRLQRFFMNKYYKPINCTNISVNAGFNIITWSDGIYNSTLFSTSNTTNNLIESTKGGRIPDVYNVNLGLSGISINIPSSLTIPSSGYTISGTRCTYDSITKMYTLDISNSPFKFSTLALGNYIITVQGKNNKYNITTDVSKAFVVSNPVVNSTIIRNGANTTYPYIDVSCSLSNLTFNSQVYADISYNGEIVSYLANNLELDASGFGRIYGNIDGIDIIQNKVYDIIIKIVDSGRTFSGTRQTVRTFYPKVENIIMTISGATNTVYMTWDPITDASGYHFEVEYYDFFSFLPSGGAYGGNKYFSTNVSNKVDVSNNKASFICSTYNYGSSSLKRPFRFRVGALNISGVGTYSEFYYSGIDSYYRPFNVLNFKPTGLGTVILDINREMTSTDVSRCLINISISGYDSDSLSSYQTVYNLSETYTIPSGSTRVDDTKQYTISTTNIKPNQRLTAHLRYTNPKTLSGELYSRTIYSYAAPITALTITKNYSNYRELTLSWSHDLSNYNQSLLTCDIQSTIIWYSVTFFGVTTNIYWYNKYTPSIISPYNNNKFFLGNNKIHDINVYPVNGDGIANKTNFYYTNIRSLECNPNIPTISGVETVSFTSTISGYIQYVISPYGYIPQLYIKYEAIQERSIMVNYIPVQNIYDFNPFTISGLSPSTTYTLYGVHKNDDNEYTLSAPVTVNTPVSRDDFTYTATVTVEDYAKKNIRLDIRVPPRLVKYYAFDYSSNKVPTLNRITSYVSNNTLFTINIIEYNNSYTMRMITYDYADISYAHNFFTVSGPAKLATIDNTIYTPTSISFNVTDISLAVARVFTANIRNTITNEITSSTTTCTSSTSYPVTFSGLLTNIKYEIYVDTYPFSGSTLNTRTNSIFITPTYMEKDRYTSALISTGTGTGSTADLYTLSNLAPGQKYDIYMTYLDQSGNRISDYSDIYTVQPYGMKPNNNYSDIQVATNSEGLFTTFMHAQSTEYAIYNISIVPNSIAADSNYNSSNYTYTKEIIIYFTWTNAIKNSINDKIGIDIYFKNNYIDIYKNIEFTNITTDTSGSITVDLSYNSLTVNPQLYDGTNASILYTGTLTVVLYHMKKIDTVFVNNPAATAIYKNSSFYIL